MHRVKSIDEIYEEVRNFDVVITNDAPLATALNGRIDRPLVGGFAYTPRHLASMLSVQVLGKPVMSDLEIVAAVSDETGLEFKSVHDEIENIRNIRRYTKDVEKYLYSESSRRIYGSYKHLPTLEKVMDLFVPETYHENGGTGPVLRDNIFLGKKTAVIGIEFFDDLDKHFIPMQHTEIEIFVYGEEYEIPVIYEIGNDRQIAENIAELIDTERTTDTAIVMDTESKIADAVRSALYRRRIPFKNTMTVRDLSQIRDFLKFLNLSMSYGTLRVRHARELFSSYGGNIWVKFDNVLLSKVTEMGERASELAECMKNIRSMTFGEVCETVVSKKHRPQVKILLEEMKFTDRKVTGQLVSEINYAVNNISDLHHNEQIPDSEKKGVLLADCHKSVFVDRPFVILLGIGAEWENRIIGRQYIDREAEAEKDALKFKVLLQQGHSRIYAVNSIKDGKPARPAALFGGIYESEGLKKAASSFSDIAPVVKGSWYEEKEEETEESEIKLDQGAETVPKLSKSAYEEFLNCPRRYYYRNLVTSPDSETSMFGNLLHAFAELYICYPEHVRSQGLEHYVEIIGKDFAGLSSPIREETDTDHIRIGLTNMTQFIDSLGLGKIPLNMKNSSREHPNELMASEGLEDCSDLAEREISDYENGIYGKIDFLDGTAAIDYKTGKFVKQDELVKNMLLTPGNPAVTQPQMYLALLKSSGTKNPCFRLFYLFGKDGSVKNSMTIRENTVDVCLTEFSKKELLMDPDSLLKDAINYKKYTDIYENWTDFVTPISEYGFPEGNWDENEDLIAATRSSLGMSKKPDVEGALKRVKAAYDKDYWIDGDKVLIPSDSMERFLEKLRSDRKTIERMNVEGFPAAPRVECKRCGYVSVCTKTPVSAESEDEYDE